MCQLASEGAYCHAIVTAFYRGGLRELSVKFAGPSSCPNDPIERSFFFSAGCSARRLLLAELLFLQSCDNLVKCSGQQLVHFPAEESTAGSRRCSGHSAGPPEEPRLVRLATRVPTLRHAGQIGDDVDRKPMREPASRVLPFVLHAPR